MKQKRAKIPSSFLAGIFLCLAGLAHADESRFSAAPDRSRIGEDESVSIQFQVMSDGSTRSVGTPQFNAPDFETLNTFQSSSVEGTYENGRFGMRSTHQINVILRPKKTGALKITGISVEVDGKRFGAPDIAINVEAGGAGTAPPSGYGGHGGLRGAAKRGDSRPFFVRAETSKDRVRKGEQVIASYYLYRSTRIFSVVPKQFPALPGFLKEDLEVPILGNRLEWERVVLDGAAYERSLLARFAAYPLKEGKLALDPFAIEVSYALSRVQTPSMDEDDPFQFFFPQMTPRTGVQKSEPVTVEVLPLPEAGKPASFTGGVGEFEVTSAMDRTEVRAGEALSLTLQIEGRGNVSAIELPPVKWPEGVDLFDTKGNVKPGQGGIGTKSFEFLLIPRKEGELKLPAIEISFFSPSKDAYVTKRTEGAVIRVLPGDPANAGGGAKLGRAGGILKDASDGKTVSDPRAGELPGWMTKLYERVKGAGAIVGAGFLALLLLIALFRAIRAWIRKKREARLARPKGADFAPIRKKFASFPDSASTGEIEALAEDLAENVVGALEERFSISIRSEPRERWKSALGEKLAIPSELWPAIEQALDLVDFIRYSGRGIDGTGWRTEFGRRLEELRAVESFLNRKRSRNEK